MTAFIDQPGSKAVKKIEVCVPLESVESLRTELTACGIVNPALMI